MYKVITSFSDNVDGGVYYIGDTYPRNGITPLPDRIDYLMSNKNKIGMPLIEEIGGTSSENSIDNNTISDEVSEKPKRSKKGK